MSSDSFFLDPNKIPPRRSVRPLKPGQLKIKKNKSSVLANYSEMDEIDEENIPEFDLLNDFSYPAELTNDPLTQAMFEGDRIQLSSFIKPNKPKNNIINLAQEASQTDAREAILAELENIDSKDLELLKKISRLETPSRATPLKFSNSTANIPSHNFNLTELKLNIVKKNPEVDLSEAVEPKLVEVKQNVATDRFRAEEDWFQVSLAAPDRLQEIKKIAQSRQEGSKDNILKVNISEEKDSKWRIFFAVFFILAMPIIFSILLLSSKNNFLKTAFNGFNSKLLSTSSFTLVNAEENSVFPELAQINSEIKNLGLPVEASDSITKFLESNVNFGWLNIFKKKNSGADFSFIGLENINQAKNILNSVASADSRVKGLEASLAKYYLSLNFWNQLFLPDKNYLVVLSDSNISWPGGGQPQNYAVVKTSAGGLIVDSSGRFSALDAAFNSKIIPPDSIKTISTSWLPSESNWFLDFRESAKTVSNFFEITTQTKIDGVVSLDKDFLKEIGFKESLIFDADSPNWFYGLWEALARKPNQRWVSLFKSLTSGLDSHKIQFYFKDNLLENFSENSNWLVAPKISPGTDMLGLSWASLKGKGLGLELAEYHGNLFEDGSIEVKLNILARQSSAGSSQNYFKFYLLKGVQILKAEGFSPKEKIPEFNYGAQGFSSDKRIQSPTISKNEIKNVDIFEESGLTVVGGWVDLESNKRTVLNLDYILPFRLSRKNTSADYGLKVFRPHQTEDAPFRFVMVPEKGISINSLEPNGFISENLGEYQGNLSQDLNLSSSFQFDN